MEDAFMSCEDRNYYRDRRVTAKPIAEPLHKHWKWGVCDVCDGKGKVVNPSIDASGLTAEDFRDDPDFKASYMAGHYDITCPRCRGRTTIPVVEHLTLKQVRAELAEAQMTIKHSKEEGEFFVNFKWSPEDAGQWCGSLNEALNVGLQMARNLSGSGE